MQHDNIFVNGRGGILSCFFAWMVELFLSLNWSRSSSIANGFVWYMHGFDKGENKVLIWYKCQIISWMCLFANKKHEELIWTFHSISMSIAEADVGKAQILLCRIVQGQPAVLRAGSDWSGLGRSVGGVDYLSNPSWYIIWNEHINSCIMPLCIVSFTKHPMIQDLGPMPVPFPLKVDMQKLCKEFKRFLPISKLQTLDDYYNSNMGNSYNFSKAVCELVGAAMFVGAILKSLEHWCSEDDVRWFPLFLWFSLSDDNWAVTAAIFLSGKRRICTQIRLWQTLDLNFQHTNFLCNL